LVVASGLHALDVHGDAFEAEFILDRQDALGEQTPSRRAIISRNSATPSASPYSSPMSSLPCWQASMARAARLPAVMVSMPRRSQMSFMRMTCSQSLISHRPPKT
jgi:hypothetical protein